MISSLNFEVLAGLVFFAIGVFSARRRKEELSVFFFAMAALQLQRELSVFLPRRQLLDLSGLWFPLQVILLIIAVVVCLLVTFGIAIAIGYGLKWLFWKR